MKAQQQVLFCVLNWGLGHATRSAPLIQKFLDEGAKVTLASDGNALQYLRNMFPSLAFLELPSYKIRYKKGALLFPHLLWKTIRSKAVLRSEQESVAIFCKANSVNFIVSDSRLGCFHPKIHSIFITHQLLPAPFRLSKILGAAYRNKLKNFQNIWVPDYEDQRLSGKLSSLQNIKNVSFIGALSQFVKTKQSEEFVLGIASGPEPHCTQLAQKLIAVFEKKALPWLLVYAGKTDLGNAKVLSMPDNNVLNALMNRAKYVVSNCGYTTLMDLDALQKKGLLFPTEGQPEQEYLYRLHKNSKQFKMLRFSELEENLY